MKYFISALIIIILLVGGGFYLFSKKNVVQNAANTPLPVEVAITYPDPLPTTYVSGATWPPVVTMLESYSCVPVSDSAIRVEERVIGGETYCVSTEAEGAAGSTYVTYGYLTDRGDAILSASFTLRFPQCLNYDDPEQSACKSEQATFDIDALAQSIVESAQL